MSSYSHSLPFDDPNDIKVFVSGLCMGRISRQIGQMIWDKEPPKAIKGLFKSAEDFDFITEHLEIENPDLVPKHTLPSGQEISFPMGTDNSLHIGAIVKDKLDDLDYIEEAMNEVKGTDLSSLSVEAKKKSIDQGYKDFISKLKSICKHFGDILDKNYSACGVNALTHLKGDNFRIVGYMAMKTDTPEAIYVNPEFLADYIESESAVEKASGAISGMATIMTAIHNSQAAYRDNSNLSNAIESYKTDVLGVAQTVKAFSNGFKLLNGGDIEDPVYENPVQVQLPEATEGSADPENVEEKLATV